MKKRLLDLLVCPACSGRLRLSEFSVESKETPSKLPRRIMCKRHCARNNEEIGESSPPESFACETCYGEEVTCGLLSCACGKSYPVLRGVPRIFTDALEMFWEDLAPWHKRMEDLVDGKPDREKAALRKKEVRQVRKRFEFQWEKWGQASRIFGRDKAQMLEQLTGDEIGPAITAEFYPGKLVLDAGCGHGRYVDCFQELGAESVGMDFGEGIDIAQKKFGDLPFAYFVQAEITAAPFRTEIFDFVFSFGVIHHTPSAVAAFKSLARLVARGGYIEIWVYPREAGWWEISQRIIRAITTKLPPRVLYPLCFLPVPLLGLKTYSGTNLRTSSWKECAQVVWDWYSPHYQSHHTREEVRSWFEDAGFAALHFLPVDVGIVGEKK